VLWGEECQCERNKYYLAKYSEINERIAKLGSPQIFDLFFAGRQRDWRLK